MTYSLIPERQSQWQFSWRVLSVGLCFFAVSLIWPGLMSRDVYGAMAYDVPAEVWALGFMSSSGLVIYGLHINGRMPMLTPCLRLAGYAMQVFLFSYLVLSALNAPDGAVVVIFGVVFFLTQIVHFIRLNVRLLVSRLKGRGNATG